MIFLSKVLLALDGLITLGIIRTTKRVCYLSDGLTDGGWDQPHAVRVTIDVSHDSGVAGARGELAARLATFLDRARISKKPFP